MFGVRLHVSSCHVGESSVGSLDADQTAEEAEQLGFGGSLPSYLHFGSDITYKFVLDFIVRPRLGTVAHCS